MSSSNLKRGLFVRFGLLLLLLKFDNFGNFIWQPTKYQTIERFMHLT